MEELKHNIIEKQLHELMAKEEYVAAGLFMIADALYDVAQSIHACRVGSKEDSIGSRGSLDELTQAVEKIGERVGFLT